MKVGIGPAAGRTGIREASGSQAGWQLGSQRDGIQQRLLAVDPARS
jgi:hypothetical protein